MAGLARHCLPIAMVFTNNLKRHILWSVCILFLTSTFSSCSGKVEDEDDTDSYKIEYLPVQFEENGLWSLVSRNGDVMYLNTFNNEPTCVIDGIFSVEEDNDEYTVYSISSDCSQPVNSLSKLKWVGYINEGLLPICHPQKRISIVNREGVEQFVLTPINGKEITMCSNHFSDGMLWIKDENDRYGFVDSKGECVISPTFENCGNFSEGKALVLIDSMWRVIDKSGKELFAMQNGQHPDWTGHPAHDEEYMEYKYDKICVTDMNYNQPDQEYHYYIYDGQGNMTQLSSKINSIVDYANTNIIYNSFSNKSGNSYIIKRDNLFDKGLITLTGDITVKPIYETLVFLNPNELLGRNIEKPVTDEGWEIIDATGNTIYNLNYNTTRIQYLNIQYVSDFGLVGLRVEERGDTYTIIKKNGEPINADLRFERFGTKKCPKYSSSIRSCYSTYTNF